MADARFAGPKIQRLAAGTVGGQRAIVLLGNSALHADNTNAAHFGKCVGVSCHASVAGDMVDVQVFGPMVDPGWNWTPDGPVFVGADGVLTQTPPTSGWLQRVGLANTATKLWVDLQPAIKLA